MKRASAMIVTSCCTKSNFFESEGSRGREPQECAGGSLTAATRRFETDYPTPLPYAVRKRQREVEAGTATSAQILVSLVSSIMNIPTKNVISATMIGYTKPM